MKHIALISPLLGAAIQIPFIVYDPARWWNILSVGFCFGIFYMMILLVIND